MSKFSNNIMKRILLHVNSLIFAILLFSGIMSAQAPAEIEKELSAVLDEIIETGSYAGNYDEEKNAAANVKFVKILSEAAKKTELLQYSFPDLSEKMSIVTSDDGKLRIYSWDTNTGGTMRSYSSLFQFITKNGTPSYFIDDSEELIGAGFYHDIFQVKLNNSNVYLAVSTFVGSTSLNGQSISTIEIDNEKLNFDKKIFRTGSGMTNSIDFSYDFFTVHEREERPIKLFKFDKKKLTLSFPVIIEDKKAPQGRVTNRFITYKFNGKEFIKVK